MSQVPASAKYYTPLFLRLYDVFVLLFSNHFAWRCPTPTVLLPFFKAHIGTEAHMDVGVGTGYYLENSVDVLSKTHHVTLLDLAPCALEMASVRLRAAGYKGNLQTLNHDIFAPLPSTTHGRFDSISLFYVFHCLPGSFPDKAVDVLANLAPALTPHGTLYGATVVGDSVRHNWIGRWLLRFYNEKGVFGNRRDTEKGLSLALRQYFAYVDTVTVGRVVLYTAKYPLSRTKPALA